MGQPKNIPVFVLGCIGALAPEIVRLYQLRHKPPKAVFSWWYYAASAFLALLGGVVALTLPAVTTWAAFYAGITTPTLISAATKHRNKDVVALANEKTKPIELQAKRAEISKPPRLETFVDVIRNHADGLFD
jgi:hypothetical protein